MAGALTLDQFAAKWADVPAGVRLAKPKAVSGAALAITKSIRAEIARATHGQNRLSGVGRRSGRKGGSKVGARYDLKGSANPTALIRATGPLHFLESGRRGNYEVRPRRRGRGGRGGRRALTIGSQFAASARPGATFGKHPWANGVRIGTPDAREAFAKAVNDAIRKSLQ